MEVHGTDKNTICDDSWERAELTSRAEMRHGCGIAAGQCLVERLGNDSLGVNDGEEIWVGWSIYIPSDEGTYSTWANSSTSSHRFILGQFMAAGNSGSPELHFILGGGGTAEGVRLDIENSPSTNATQEVPVVRKASFTLPRDKWIDLVIKHKRSWVDGSIRIWIDGVEKVTWTGPTSIRDKPYAYWKSGIYYGKTVYNNTFVIYTDSLKIGDGAEATDEEDYALVAPSETVVPPDPGEEVTITSVNAGSAITDEQARVPFTVTGLGSASVVGCLINGNSADERTVKWDYSTGTAGIFAAGDIDQYASSSATLKCFFEEALEPSSMSLSTWINDTTTKTDEAGFSGDHFGYTDGITITKNDTITYAATYRSFTTDVISSVAGDLVRFDFEYYCTSTYCDDLYFSVTDYTTDARNDAVGSAGALTLMTPAVGGGNFGSSIEILNRTLSEGVYRVGIQFRETQATARRYKVRAGSKNGPIGHEITLHSVVPRKNWTTRSVDTLVNFDLDITDVTAPTLSSCAMTNVINAEFTGYQAGITCATDESGGTAYAMITTTNTAPNAADVIAGTGSIWSANAPVDTAAIEFDASGMAYQDLWGWIVHQDAAANNSAVEGVMFDDGVGPGEVKKLKWSYAGSNAIRCYNTATGGVDLFTGDMSVILTDGDYFTQGATVTELAYDSTVTFTAGQAEIVEADLESGSINALISGDQGYNYWAQNADKSCRADNTIQLTIE